MKNKTYNILIVSILFLCLLSPIFACKTTKYTQYSYADGNGNLYLIQKYSLEYKPIKPIESSSGTYSGGKYVKKRISKKQYYRLATLIKKAKQNKYDQIKKRIKGSGLIIIKINYKKIYRFILKPGSRSQRLLENALIKFKKK